MAAFQRSLAGDDRERAKIVSFLVGASALMLLQRGLLAADPDRIPAPPAHGRPFDEVLSERIITGARKEPVFIDIDTGRWMTPPTSLLTPENDGQPFHHWNLSEPLKHWIQHSGVDLAVKTDGQHIALVGFDLRVGDSLTQRPKVEAQVANSVSRGRLQGDDWVTLRRLETVPIPGGANANGKLAPQFGTPFVTREGGLGTFTTTLTDFRGPNSIRMDYYLTRRPYVPQLTGQQVFPIYEPPILGQMSTFLIADVADQKLCLRTPGSSNQIEISSDEVVVREAAHPELRAVRLHTGTLEIDAPAGVVTVNGRGKSATLRRIGNRVQVELKNRVADSDEIVLWMPGLEIHDSRLKWESVKADLPRKLH